MSNEIITSKEIELKNTIIENMKEKLTFFEKENEGLKIRVDELEVKLNDAYMETTRWKLREGYYLDELKKLNALLKITDENYQNQYEELKRFESAYETVFEMKEELEKALDKQKVLIADKDESIRDLNEKIAFTEGKMVAVQNRSISHSQKLSKKLADCRSLEREMERLTDEFDDMKLQEVQHGITVNKLKAKVRRLEDENDLLSHEYNKLKEVSENSLKKKREQIAEANLTNVGSVILGGILNEVIRERQRQDEKWGEQNHSPIEFLAILGEEVGEANKHALQAHFADVHSNDKGVSEYRKEQLAAYRKELIQISAVAVQMAEAFDRN